MFPRLRRLVTSEPARIAFRVLGLVLVLVSLACLVLLLWPGPARVAEALGTTCANDRQGSSYQCTWFDAASLLWTGFWVSLIIGVVLRLVTRPEGKGPITIDLSRLRRG